MKILKTMRREIRFRGMSIKSGEWLVGDYIRNRGLHFIAPPGIADPQKTWEDFEIFPDTLGQFTGLKDKEGRDIYDGDVVKWDDMSGGKDWRFAVVRIDPDIIFDCSPVKAVCGVTNSTDYVFHYGRLLYQQTYNFLTVIGNIHDKDTDITYR